MTLISDIPEEVMAVGVPIGLVMLQLKVVLQVDPPAEIEQLVPLRVPDIYLNVALIV